MLLHILIQMIITLEWDYLLTSDKSQLVSLSLMFNVNHVLFMPQGDTDKMINLQSQICNGTISHNKCLKEYILHGKFHACFKKCTPFGLCRPTK